MFTITDTQTLSEFCKSAANCEYVTVDTEFIRERSYYSKLCLIQLAFPGTSPRNSVLVDPLVDGLSLQPLYDLFLNDLVMKVFHAARQDLEIFCLSDGVIPKPIFDTQVAAMVCGFGEQVGYETLVNKITGNSLDKSSRFTDWSRRPLSDAQKNYALADVTHLRQIYEFLCEKLQENGRSTWLEEELEILTNPSTYIVQPKEAWRRLKTRSTSPKFLAAIKTLAQFREKHAQTKDVPRNRIFKDDALIEVASTRPTTLQDLNKSRLLQRDARRGVIAEGILTAVKLASEFPHDETSTAPETSDRQYINPALADLLRVLLKAKTEELGVASKLVASASDLDAMASGNFEVPAMKGWRYEVFGEAAFKLCKGTIGLATKDRKVVCVKIENGKLKYISKKD